MKAVPKKLLPLTLLAIAVASLFFVRPAQAYTVTLEQIGSNVVANGSGAFNLSGLTFDGFVGVAPTIIAEDGQIVTGPTEGAQADFYTGFTGPTSFGTGGLFQPFTGSGNVVGIGFGGFLLVPHGYVSGSALSDSMTFPNNQTLASLGVTPGTYVWTWGTGANQNFTLIIGGAGVPDGGSTVSLLGCALLGFAALRRKLSC
jgi:VPDSG-CTERM motif